MGIASTTGTSFGHAHFLRPRALTAVRSSTDTDRNDHANDHVIVNEEGAFWSILCVHQVIVAGEEEALHGAHETLAQREECQRHKGGEEEDDERTRCRHPQAAWHGVQAIPCSDRKCEG